MKLIERIKKETGKIALLIDHEKTNSEKSLSKILEKIETKNIDYIFVGGSTDKKIDLDPIIIFIKKKTTLPVIIFPGNHTQVSKYADGIFYLTLLTTKNSKYLIEEQLKSSEAIFNSKIEVLPTGYILIDEEKESSTSKLTDSESIKISDNKKLLNYSLTAKFLGKKILLFDTGSGSKKSMQNTYLKEIKSKTKLPIIVGGGIKSTKEIINLKKLGVNIIIVGNKIENDSMFLDELRAI